jgi:FkbM family methyltransferase
MNFENPAWRAAPVRTGLRVAKSLLRRAVPSLTRVSVPYDDGQSQIYADLRTPLGLGLYRYGHRDADIRIVSRLLAPGDIFVDGGAHVGLFTLVAARCVGPSGRVIAFEPAGEVREKLIQNVKLNGFEQVTVKPLALSSEPGRASFRVFELVGSGLNHLGPAAEEGGRVESVEVTTLDASIGLADRSRVTVMKLDLEGAEYSALLGGEALLAEAHPELVLEVEQSYLARMGSSVEAVEALLQKHGYSFYRTGMDRDGTAWVSPIERLSQAAPRPNVLATRRPERLRERGVNIR